MNYQFFSSGGSSFGGASGGGRGDVGPRTTHFHSHKFGCWFDGDDLASCWSRYYRVGSSGGSSFGVSDGDW